MEKLRAAIMPEVFTVIKVTKSTLEFLRFDAEIENKKNLPQVISKIDQKVRSKAVHPENEMKPLTVTFESRSYCYSQ